MQQSKSINNPFEVDALLESAAARNLPMEMHLQDSTSDRVIIARTRVLEIDDEELRLDRPQIIGGKISFVKGQPVDLYFRLDDVLYCVQTRVRRIPVPIELRVSKLVIGITVARPKVVLSGQRRNFFRLLVAAMEPIRATLHDASRDAKNAAPVDARRFAGKVVDLSQGGLAIRVDDTPVKIFSMNDPFYLAFRLPGAGASPGAEQEDTNHILLGRVRQVRGIQDTGNTRIGLEFLQWPDRRRFQREQDMLQHFITRMQRERLRKAG